MRLEQIIKNLLSNAFKFTESGSITLRLFKESESSGSGSEHMLGFSVTDTGIGIPKDKQALIFQSFRQVDGSMQRKYGGTGLGLTICKRISELLGGSINVKSKEGRGSVFTIMIPADSTGKVKVDQNGRDSFSTLNAEKTLEPSSFATVRHPDKKTGPASEVGSSVHKVFVVSDSEYVQNQLLNIADNKKFLFLASEKSEQIPAKIKEYSPDHILIDPFVSSISGWSLAKNLSVNTTSADIPIWILKDPDRPVPEFELPFIQGYLRLPFDHIELDPLLQAAPPIKPGKEGTLLLVDDNEMHNTALKEFTADLVDRCLTAESAEEAFQILSDEVVHCIVLDLTLPDATGADVLQKFAADKRFSDIPVIVYSGKSLSSDEESELREHASDVIFKNVGSYSKLVEKISTLLQDNLRKSNKSESEQESKQRVNVLIADDDYSSYFSLSSYLKSQNIHPIHAPSGREAVKLIKSDSSIDIILMDIMMPDTDGLEVLKTIRTLDNRHHIPVISVTAKAMKGDREECLKMGANDYISKPIDPDKLLNLISIWTDFSV